jgi:RHS repeat-associated protein
VLSKTQVVRDDPAVPSTFRLEYAWQGGQLARIGYPSGMRVAYRRDATGQIVGIDVQLPGSPRRAQPLLPFVSGLSYTALGQPAGWAWSSGDVAARRFDADGRLTHTEFSSYGHDAAGRITTVTQSLWARRTGAEPVPVPLSWTVAYDRRDRIVEFSRAGSSSRFTYDANGNRLSAVSRTISDSDLDGAYEPQEFARTLIQQQDIEAASNRLLGVTLITTVYRSGSDGAGRSSAVRLGYSLDASGSLSHDGVRGFEHDAAGRLAQVQVSSDGETLRIPYLHNALGQRVFKGEATAEQAQPSQANLGAGFIGWLRRYFGGLFRPQPNTRIGTAYVFGDGDGAIPPWALLGEYDNGSARGRGRTEYIWLPLQDGSAIPLGYARAGRLYSIHPDHLGTPRLVKDDTNTPVWQWPYSAFGDNPPTGLLQATNNPRAAITNQPQLLRPTAAPELNLRFAGQYHDPDAGAFYNYHRWYRAAEGRYVQSDPIGLAGGLNPYAYVEGNPVSAVDPLGLATYMCTQPLHALGAAGRAVYSPSSNPLYHQFIGILRPDGSVITGGQDRAAGPFGPGRPSEGDGAPGSGAECKKVEDDNECIERCLIGKFATSRPRYSLVLQGITGGQNCQGWANNNLAQCQTSCKAKR